LNTEFTREHYLSQSEDGHQQVYSGASDFDGTTQGIEVCGRGIKVQGRLLRIARIRGDKYKFLDDPERLLDGLRKCGMRIDLFTFMQRLPETSPKYPYPMEWDNLAALPVTTFEHWWNHQIRSYPRNRARQAEKRGVTFREMPFDETLVRGIWEVYNECPVRQGTPFRHFGDDMETIYKAHATFLDSSVFIGAFLGDSMIGFVKLVYDETRTQANLMNIVAMIRHKDKAPTNALIAQSVRTCAERGIRYLVYQNFAYRRKEQDSLSHFKEVNGFQRIEVPRYYVPLTLLGRFALRLGLHHEFADRVPESVASGLRRLRAAWYNRKFQSEAHAQ
jgi:hypothetical protein